MPLAPGQRQPLRIVLDRTGTLPPTLALFTDGQPTLAVAGPGAAPAYAEAVQNAGGAVWTVPEPGDHLDLGALLDALGAGRDAAGTPLPQNRTLVQSILVEAGPGLATALLREHLADRLRWFVAPKLVGTGRQATGTLGIDAMSDALAFARPVWETVGPDALLSAWRV